MTDWEEYAKKHPVGDDEARNVILGAIANALEGIFKIMKDKEDREEFEREYRKEPE
jgi:hypothetical protein